MKPMWMAARTSGELVRRYCPVRDPFAHKGDFGRVVIVAGGEGYTGAPVLAAWGAIRTGAGLIFTGVPRGVYPIVASKLDAPMVFPLPDKEGYLAPAALPVILEKLQGADACLVGPGLGRGEAVEELVLELLRACRCPLILDADGINAVSGHIDQLRGAACPIVLTPHEGELRRLTRAPEQDRLTGAMALAEETGCIVLRKGHETIITDGKKTYLNRTGNAGMATGGSGDVLSGILLALLGQKVPPLGAAATAAWLHGTAGDLAARELGQYAMTPGDLLDRLPRLLP